MSNDGHVTDIGRPVHEIADLIDGEVDHLVGLSKAFCITEKKFACPTVGEDGEMYDACSEFRRRRLVGTSRFFVGVEEKNEGLR